LQFAYIDPGHRHRLLPWSRLVEESNMYTAKSFAMTDPGWTLLAAGLHVDTKQFFDRMRELLYPKGSNPPDITALVEAMLTFVSGNS
jgi:hypothetical protein